jgi:hypothetical protein
LPIFPDPGIHRDILTVDAIYVAILEHVNKYQILSGVLLFMIDEFFYDSKALGNFADHS